MAFSEYSFIGNQKADFFGLPDTTQRHVTGLMADAMHFYWGGNEIIYIKANGAIRQGGLCVLTHAVSGGAYVALATEVPNTTLLARPLYVAMTSMTSGQFGWMIQSGLAPVNCNASIAADTAIGIVAAGQGGAVAAGKSINGARVVAPASTTVAKAGNASSNSLLLQISDPAGWFIGVYLSGTGIAAGTTVVDIDPSGTQVTLSAVTTAIVNGTVTATYNNGTIYYNVVHLNRPQAQGPIT